MISAATAASNISRVGFTHVVWIPDSYVGPWESPLVNQPGVKLIRACREGEAIAIAAGLILGGAKPVVSIQCTGLFEAGDALRNVVHDLRLPLKLIVGVRSYLAHLAGKSADSCPVFTEPILNAWRLPYTLLGEPDDNSFAAAVGDLATSVGANVLLLGE